MMRTVKQLKWSTGVLFLVVVALLYLVPYSMFVRRPKPELTEIFFADRVTDAHRILIDEYNALHAGKVKVTPIDFPNSQFNTNERKEILARSLRGEGDGIDLLAVDVVWVQRFSKWCAPMGNYFSGQELQEILPEALFSCYEGDRLMAVPLDMVLGVMYYREDLLKSEKGGDEIIRTLGHAMTWPEFLRLKQRLRWQKPYYIFPAADYEGLICSFIEILLGLDRDYFATDGFNFNTPEARETLQFMVDLVRKYEAAPAVVTGFTEVSSYEYFIRNDGLFIRGWTSYGKDFANSPVDRGKESQLRMAPLPYLPGGRPASVFGGWNLMISKFSTKKEAVVDFIKFLLSKRSQEIFYTHGGHYPVVSSFYADSSNQLKYPDIGAIKALMRTGVHRPRDREYTNVSKIMSHYFGMALKNMMSVDEALAGATRDIQSEKILVVTR